MSKRKFKIVTPKPIEVERLHKQSRSQAKTIAKYVGKITEEVNLFTLPNFDLDETKDETEETKEIIPKREKIAKGTAILSQHLMQLLQQGREDELVITNISELAERFNTTNYEIKRYLLNLGGYVYPIVDIDEKTKELVISTEQLFTVEFRYSPETKKKYDAGELEEVRSGVLMFLKEERPTKIIVRPNQRFKRALERGGLGNVLVVNDEFTSLSIGLTEIAYKILNYTASNRPNKTINEKSLIRDLGLEKQVKSQGAPRVIDMILKGFKELQDKEHISAYSHSKGFFKYSYTTKYIKHQDRKKAD